MVENNLVEGLYEISENFQSFINQLGPSGLDD